MRRLAGALVFAAACAACNGSGGPPKAPMSAGPPDAMLTAEGSPIALRRSLVADHYFWLRAKVLEGEAPKEYGEAYSAMQELRADFAGDPTAWEDLEVPLGAVSSASELLSVYGGLPERRDVGGRPVPLRADATRLARAMIHVEDSFRRGPYHDHADEIAKAASDLGQRLVPHVQEILRAIQTDMGVSGSDRPIVITLVGDAPYPGIFAADAKGHVMASFVRVRGLDGGALVETILHESLHAYDEMTVREKSTAMNALRAALGQRGMDESDPNVEMAVNTVTFAEAASLVRRFVDKTHKPLGESGFYTLYPPAPAIVEAWSRRVETGEAIDATADAIAKAVAAPPPP